MLTSKSLNFAFLAEVGEQQSSTGLVDLSSDSLKRIFNIRNKTSDIKI